MNQKHLNLINALKDCGIDPEAIGNYCARHLGEDQEINKLTQEIRGRCDYYGKKEELSSVELLSIILTKKQHYGKTFVSKNSR